MSKAKDCKHSLAPWMVTCLGLTLSLIDSGCSSISGFRSVGTERPSFFSFWDRSSRLRRLQRTTRTCSACEPGRRVLMRRAKRETMARSFGSK